MLGIIDIHVDDPLISGSIGSIGYISRKMKGRFDATGYEGNRSTYLDMGVKKWALRIAMA